MEERLSTPTECSSDIETTSSSSSSVINETSSSCRPEQQEMFQSESEILEDAEILDRILPFSPRNSIVSIVIDECSDVNNASQLAVGLESEDGPALSILNETEELLGQLEEDFFKLETELRNSRTDFSDFLESSITFRNLYDCLSKLTSILRKQRAEISRLKIELQDTERLAANKEDLVKKLSSEKGSLMSKTTDLQRQLRAAQIQSSQIPPDPLDEADFMTSDFAVLLREKQNKIRDLEKQLSMRSITQQSISFGSVDSSDNEGLLLEKIMRLEQRLQRFQSRDSAGSPENESYVKSLESKVSVLEEQKEKLAEESQALRNDILLLALEEKSIQIRFLESLSNQEIDLEDKNEALRSQLEDLRRDCRALKSRIPSDLKSSDSELDENSHLELGGSDQKSPLLRFDLEKASLLRARSPMVKSPSRSRMRPKSPLVPVLRSPMVVRKSPMLFERELSRDNDMEGDEEFSDEDYSAVSSSGKDDRGEKKADKDEVETMTKNIFIKCKSKTKIGEKNADEELKHPKISKEHLMKRTKFMTLPKLTVSSVDSD